MNPSDWPPPDDHLRAALRHAPDRDDEPPAALSAHILGQARQAVAPPSRPRRWLAWLARPTGAAAFASLMLAGVIGLMWRGDLPRPETRLEPQPALSRESAAALKSESDTAATGMPTPPGNAQPAPPVAPPTAPAAVGPALADGAAPAEARTRMPAREASPAADAAARSSTAPLGAAMDPVAAVLAALRAADAPPPRIAAWLDLQVSARGRWQVLPMTGPPEGDEVRTPGGALLGHLATDGSRLRWQAAQDGVTWQAPLPTEVIERLRASPLR